MPNKKSEKAGSLRYAVLLRGINVGGKTLKMEAFKKALASLKLRDITTILASGNAVCTADETDAATLSVTIEAALRKVSGLNVHVLLRTIPQLQKLAAGRPFKNVEVTPETRRFVTFLSEKPKVTFVAPDKDVVVTRSTNSELCWVIRTSDVRTVDIMAAIEKAYGKNVTTRNWNTVEKILRS